MCLAVYLKDGNHRSGIVVVYDKTGSLYGKICSKTFDDLAAGVVCRQVGFKKVSVLRDKVGKRIALIGPAK